MRRAATVLDLSDSDEDNDWSADSGEEAVSAAGAGRERARRVGLAEAMQRSHVGSRGLVWIELRNKIGY